MLRLVRIANSRSNAPELEKVPISKFDVTLYKGVAIEKQGDVWGSASVYPYYITANTPEEDDKYVYCYRVTPDMVFVSETEEYDTCEVGNYVSLSSTYGLLDSVVVSEDGPGRIVELVPDSKFIYVKFDRRREYDQ